MRYAEKRQGKRIPRCWTGDQLSIAYDGNEHSSHFGCLNLDIQRLQISRGLIVLFLVSKKIELSNLNG